MLEKFDTAFRLYCTSMGSDAIGLIEPMPVAPPRPEIQEVVEESHKEEMKIIVADQLGGRHP